MRKSNEKVTFLATNDRFGRIASGRNLIPRCPPFRTRFSSNSLKRKMPDLSIEHSAERGGLLSNPNYAELEKIHELVLEIERNNSGNENVLIKTAAK